MQKHWTRSFEDDRSAPAWLGTVALLVVGVGLTTAWLAFRLNDTAPADRTMSTAVVVAGLCCVLTAGVGAFALLGQETRPRPYHASAPPVALHRATEARRVRAESGRRRHAVVRAESGRRRHAVVHAGGPAKRFR